MKLTQHNYKEEVPPNYDELKKAANRMANWKERLAAVEELGNWKTEHTISILLNRMKNDPVYRVQEAAYGMLRNFGENVEMPERNEHELIKDTHKVLVRIKKSLPADHTYEDFKEKLQKMRSDIYDTYKGDKGEDFEAWLQAQWKAAPVRTRR
ncbi:HEAT repeat domain-containing protein [Metaplanococcus flavidus]|uniref:HEAT repeat domain-containing protein n=1 Tax=Metaplanococcus flavidus TaxID=569883 RepID=A0ABW3LCE0_9BACL